LLVPIVFPAVLGVFIPRLRLMALIPLAAVCFGFLRRSACGKNVRFTDRHSRNCGKPLQ